MLRNLGRYGHPPKGGRNILAGRHNAGANPAPGSGMRPPNRAGQPEPAGNKPITGGKTEMRPRNPSIDSKNQVAQIQSQISAPPAPFKTTGGIVNVSAPSVSPNGPTQAPTNNLRGTRAPAHPPKQYRIKTKSHMVGVGNAPRKVGKMTASATKGGHSLLYGD